jgi:hypothetical protein
MTANRTGRQMQPNMSSMMSGRSIIENITLMTKG